jgi:DNA invertase Pin-like site-specific DNA recombinase
VNRIQQVKEFERSLILQRTNEGRAKAKADGKVFGRNEASGASAPRGVEVARSWRDDARDCAQLQCCAHKIARLKPAEARL